MVVGQFAVRKRAQHFSVRSPAIQCVAHIDLKDTLSLANNKSEIGYRYSGCTMCPGPAYIANRIALLSDEDEIKIENRRAYATSKLLGAITVGAEVSDVRFFLDDEDEVPQDPKTPIETPSWKNEQVDLLLRNDELESLTALSYLENKVCSGVTVKLTNSVEKLSITPKEQPAGFREQNEKATDLIKPYNRSLLKSPSSPTSGVKKSVRFADSVGHDLEHVKLFHSHEDDVDNYSEFDYPPASSKWPAFLGTSSASANSHAPDRQLLKRFSLSNKHNISQVTEERNVCIESISIKGMSVSGFIHVKNIAFEKQVNVRYTLDGWGTYAEMLCSFSYSKLTNNQDVFYFLLCLPFDLPVGSSCEMCVRFSTGGQEFWDSNNDANYNIDCCVNDTELDNCTSTQSQTSSFCSELF